MSTIKSKRCATLQDIAEATGVSMMTVSRVLRDSGNAHKERYRMIWETAESLNYRPNLAARQLATQQSNVIVMLIDSLAPRQYFEVMVHLERLAFAAGFRLQVGLMHNSLEANEQYVQDFAGRGVEKIVCAAHSYPEFAEKVPDLFSDFPRMVFLEKPAVPTQFSVIAADHYAAHLELAEKLLHHGYRRIFYLRHAYRDWAYAESRRGFLQAFADSGIAGAEQFWREVPLDDDYPAHFTREVKRVAESKADVLIVSNCAEALKAQRILSGECGIKVPEDMAVFSVDGSEYAEETMPSIACFRHDARTMARKVFDAVASEKQTAQMLELVKADIFPGESCPMD